MTTTVLVLIGAALLIALGVLAWTADRHATARERITRNARPALPFAGKPIDPQNARRHRTDRRAA